MKDAPERAVPFMICFIPAFLRKAKKWVQNIGQGIS
jgi:hypothetical protein